jgi:UDP-N-acetylmuramate dehydrogenase
VRIAERVPLADRTTLRLGGPARWFAACVSDDEVREALTFARGRGVPVLVLGGGSNVVVSDAGFPGLVLHVALRGVARQPDGDAVLVTAAAGEQWDGVVAAACAHGLAGIECLSGIPGTVGAAPIQNIGAYGQEIAETLFAVEVIHRGTLERDTIAAAACGFGYRTSRFKRGERDTWVVVGVRLRLRPGGPAPPRYQELERALAAAGHPDGRAPAEALQHVRETVLALRRHKSMVLDDADPETRSVGSFFTNPVVGEAVLHEVERRWAARGGSGAVPRWAAPGGVKLSAAWLVERAGFPRGTRRGGVGVSANHSLALVNRGGTSAELLELAGEIRAAVAEVFGVELETEPVVVGGRESTRGGEREG